jgi:hypothetical protein
MLFLGPFFTSGQCLSHCSCRLLAARHADPLQITKVCKTSSTKTWSRPHRTPDGQPDLTRSLDQRNSHPFERPPQLAGRATITEKEALEFEKRASATPADAPPPPGDPGGYNAQVWSDGGSTWLSTRQASLVVDPPDGRVPVKPAAEARRKYDLEHVADSYEHHSTWERCITRGVPGGMLPAGYNAYQILQSPAVVILSR